jgi:hypothetical protein
MILTFNCSTTDPEISENKVALKEIDVAVSEVYLKIEVEKANPNQVVILKRNGETVLSYTANITDTVLADTGLIAGSNYSYQAEIKEESKLAAESQKLSIQTLQPTSHEFSWEVIKLGDPSTSELWDVAIIDENNIWAVGDIKIVDTSERGYTNYNAVHWDGNEWVLKKILYKSSIWEIKTLLGFSENDIWFSAFVRYDGKNFIDLQIPDILIGWGVNKIWGNSSENLYVVGNNGNIVQYDGTNWQKLESGTEGNITSVWGITEEESGDEYLYYTIPSEKKLLRIKNKQEIENTGWNENKTIADVWGARNELLYGAGEDGVYRKLGNKWEVLDIGSQHFFVSIGGQGLNDLIFCGISGGVSHYNGISWKEYPELQSPSLSLRQAAIKDNTVVMVGIDSSYAVIIIGKR